MMKASDVVTVDGSVLRRKPVLGDMHWDGKAWQRWSGRRWTKAAYSVHPERLANAAPFHHEPAIDEDRRHRALSLAVEDHVSTNGATVILDGPSGFVLAYRPQVAHLFHALMTLVTGGLWGVVWLAVALGRREDRVRFEVDHWGNVWARSVASA